MYIAIVGPTGVGKTKLSIMLAQKYKAIIISADSCQVYKYLNIGTAKIKEEEKMGIKHYLIDCLEPTKDYSVADYQKDMRQILTENKDKNIIIVGGTGLYLKAALYDYQFSNLKDINLDKYTNQELFKMCQEIDSNIKIDINNRRRLENYLKREEKVASNPKLLYDVKFIGLTTDRETLYNKINKRVDEMFEEGLVKEVQDLVSKYGENKVLKNTIGYKEVIKYLNKEISLEEAKELIKKNSRHYAKRQYTYFNNQLPVKWFNTDYNDFNKTYEEVINYLDN